jgi:hypothetical protein
MKKIMINYEKRKKNKEDKENKMHEIKQKQDQGLKFILLMK